MNKIGKIMLEVFMIIIFIIPTFIAPETVSAQTLADLKAELAKEQAEYTATQNAKALTESQMVQVNKEINSVKAQIEQTYKEINALTDDINKLNIEIVEKDEEMKEIVKFLQVANGDAAYLEYTFGAQSFTDFIYRMAVSEQLTAYNDKLIKEYNNLIEENKNKQKQIEAKRVDLGNQQISLTSKYVSLGQKASILSDSTLSIADEIKAQKEIIEFYENLGCKDNESLSTCGRSVLPKGTAFYRPMASGYVTSEWGVRGSGWHEGIDQSNSTYGVNVYSVASGKVVYIMNKFYCGGNMVIVHHNINGKTYTSVYAHLRTISANVGDNVTKDYVIGTMGGGADTEYYDTCTFGQHLHLTVANGLYGVDYNSWSSMNYTYSINPRTVINYPSGVYNQWVDRLTKY